MNIQKTLFQNHLMYKDVGKRDDYPAVADLDYYGQVFIRMKKELSVVTAKGKVCGGSRLMEATSEQRTLEKAMPDVLCFAPKEVLIIPQWTDRAVYQLE